MYVLLTVSSSHGPRWCWYSLEKFPKDSHLPIILSSISTLKTQGDQFALDKTLKKTLQIVLPNFGKSFWGHDCREILQFFLKKRGLNWNSIAGWKGWGVYTTKRLLTNLMWCCSPLDSWPVILIGQAVSVHFQTNRWRIRIDLLMDTFIVLLAGQARLTFGYALLNFHCFLA